MQLGVYEKTLSSTDLHSQLHETQELGFDFFELAIDESPERQARLDWSLQQRRSALNEANAVGTRIDVVTLSAHRATPLGSADAEVRAASGSMLRKATELASDLGAQLVQIAGYFTFYEEQHADGRAFFIEGLSEGCERARTAGVRLALENVDGENVTSVTDGLGIVDAVRDPALGLFVDVGNLAANGHDVLAQLHAALPHLLAVDLKDTRLGEYRRVNFGDGKVPFREVFELLDTNGFHGPFAMEMWNDEADRELVVRSRQWLLDAAREAC